MSSPSNHLTYRVADHYPVSQFQELSNKVNRKRHNNNSSKHRSRSRPSSSSGRRKAKVSPREEIYKSMLREIKNEELGNMDSLVHKASGILRLQHYRDIDRSRKYSVSWDFDGRRVLTYEDEGGQEKSRLQRQTSMDKSRKTTLWNSLNEPVFGLDSLKRLNLTELSNVDSESIYSGSGSGSGGGRSSSRHRSNTYNSSSNSNNEQNGDQIRESTPVIPKDFGDLPGQKFSKVWEHYINTGDASKLWESKEGIFASDNERRPPSVTSGGSSDRKSFSNISSIPDDYYSPVSAYAVSGSKQELSHKASFWSTSSAVPVASSEKKKKPSRSTTQIKRNKNVKEKEEKVERVQHICVVNGSVVTFKDFGFENFTNWFGDDTMLEANQQRSQPKFHLELDLTEVDNKDIKIRLLEGYKLEVEGQRRLDGTLKSIRLKDILLLPKGQKPEDLLMCRTKTGKLVVEDITSEAAAHASPTPSTIKSKSLKSKTKWRIP